MHDSERQRVNSSKQSELIKYKLLLQNLFLAEDLLDCGRDYCQKDYENFEVMKGIIGKEISRLENEQRR